MQNVHRFIFGWILFQGAVLSQPSWSAAPCRETVLESLVSGSLGEGSELLGKNSPLGDAFPKLLKKGALDRRIQKFVDRWPGVVTLVDNVEFAFADDAGQVAATKAKSKRKVLNISYQKLSGEDRKKLIKDYLETVGSGTLSFPSSEGGGHLYVRLGTKSFDNLFEIRTGDYRAPSSDRLEPLLTMNSDEELRVRRYFENAVKNYEKVVGPFDYEGATRGKTNARINDNRPLTKTEGHNCTSWLCTAPIAKSKQSFIEVVGATPSMELHTNPGWWNSWLVGKAPQERVPYVVFWDLENRGLIESGKPISSWNFDRH
jgi:hypothetical protein